FARYSYDYPQATRLHHEILAGHPSPALRIYALLGLAIMQFNQALVDEAVPNAERAAAEARVLFDSASAAEAYVRLATEGGVRDISRDSVRTLFALARQFAPVFPPLQATVSCSYGRFLREEAPQEAMRSAAEGIRIAEKAGDTRATGFCYLEQSTIHSANGRREEALRVLDTKVIPLLRKGRDRQGVAQAYSQKAFEHFAMADYYNARIAARAAIVGGGRSGNFRAVALARVQLAQIYVKSGDLGGAEAQLDSAREPLRVTRSTLGQARAAY